MRSIGLSKYVAAIAALSIASACSSGSTVVPSNATSAGATSIANGLLTTAARPNGGLRAYQTLVPNAPLAGPNYEYIFNQYDSYADIFNYPKSTKQIGSIKGLGGQGCTNVLYGYGKGIFWNVGGPKQITEFKVPRKPIKTLSVSYVFPSSCAMDTSGDLAVGILYGNSSGGNGGEVVVFKNSTGSGTVYQTPLDEEFFDGYDPNGNIFADGFTGDRSGFALVEIPKGSSKGEAITIPNSVQFPGSVQWDGTYVTVFDQIANETFRYSISGTTATLKDTVTYTGSSDCAQTWIAKGLMYCGDAGNDGGEVFRYPVGGQPIATFTGNFDEPLGVTAAK